MQILIWLKINGEVPFKDVVLAAGTDGWAAYTAGADIVTTAGNKIILAEVVTASGKVVNVRRSSSCSRMIYTHRTILWNIKILKQGAIFDSPCVISGGDWVAEETPIVVKEAVKETQVETVAKEAVNEVKEQEVVEVEEEIEGIEGNNSKRNQTRTWCIWN